MRDWQILDDMIEQHKRLDKSLQRLVAILEEAVLETDDL